MSNESALEVSPGSCLVDRETQIRVSGLPANHQVILKASATDDAGKEWASRASFKSGPDGIVDPGELAPVSGTYESIDPMGLVWSMKPVLTGKEEAPFDNNTAQPETVTISVEDDGKTILSEVVERVFLGPGVERTPVREGTLVGVFFRPPAGKPQPGVIVLGGSDGGLREDYAALLASHGFPSLALAYFAQEGLPEELLEIPLEHVENGIGWMQAQEAVDGDRLAVIGKSKGGELALLAAATFSKIKTVVSYVGSGLVFQGVPRDPRNANPESSWTYRGKPLPYVPLKWGPLDIARAILAGIAGRPLSMARIYEKNMKDTEAVEKAAIPVEKINGPVLLVSGRQDSVWPSSDLSDLVIGRLESKGHTFHHQHLCYDDAGHRIGVPYQPTTVDRSKIAAGRIIRYGGSPPGNALASRDAWPRTVRFLREYLTG